MNVFEVVLVEDLFSEYFAIGLREDAHLKTSSRWIRLISEKVVPRQVTYGDILNFQSFFRFLLLRPS